MELAFRLYFDVQRFGTLRHKIVINVKTAFRCFGSVKNLSMNSSSTFSSSSSAVIGDEILKGQVRDSVIHFLGRNLYGLGIPLRKVTVFFYRGAIVSIPPETFC